MPIQAPGFKYFNGQSVGCFPLDSNGVGHRGRGICREEVAPLTVAGKQRERVRRGQALFQGQIQVTQLPPSPSSVLKVPLPPSSVTGWEASLQQGFGERVSLWLQQLFTVSLWSTNGSRGLVLVFSSSCTSPDSSPSPACSQGLLVAQAVIATTLPRIQKQLENKVNAQDICFVKNQVMACGQFPEL